MASSISDPAVSAAGGAALGGPAITLARAGPPAHPRGDAAAVSGPASPTGSPAKLPRRREVAGQEPTGLVEALGGGARLEAGVGAHREAVGGALVEAERAGLGEGA